MWRRILILLRARLRSGPQGGSPAAILLYQAALSSFLFALVRDSLPPFAYGVFAMGLTALMIAIPLIGELGWILRRDEATPWVAALPLHPVEVKLARMLHLLISLWVLSLGTLLPAALFAPTETIFFARCMLPFLGLGIVSLVAALLLAVQNLLGERAEGLLIAFQTLLVVGVVVGIVTGAKQIAALAKLPNLGADGAGLLWFFPPAWFAAPLAGAEGQPERWWLPLAIGLGSVLALVLLPAPQTARSVRTPWLGVLLAPLRRVANKLWVRREERGIFDLVFDALPREREVVLRTIPMLGIPLAFLVVAAGGEDGATSAKRVDLLALLFFTAGIYLPILLTHVPASASPRAAWLHQTAPLSRGALVSGTIKALVLRFLVPLYAVLTFIAWYQAGAAIALRLAPPGFLVSIFVIRKLHDACVQDAPLSIRAADIRFEMDWFGLLGGLSMGLTLLAILASRLPLVYGALPITALLLILEWHANRALASSS